MNRTARRALARAQARTPRPAARRTGRWQADARAHWRTIARVQPFTPEEILRLTIPGRVAFEALRSGSGTEGDWHTLAALANVAMVAGERIDQRCVDCAQAAQAALMRALDRGHRLGRWLLDGQGLQDIPAVLDLYDQLVELCTPIQMHAAYLEVLRRAEGGEWIGNAGSEPTERR